MLAALESGPATLAGLVAGTGLARPTAHRLAVALEHHRLVARDMQGRFVLGPRLAELSAAAGEDRLLAAAGPVLARLRDITGESAQLCRRQGEHRVCVAAAERPSGLRDTIPVGSQLTMRAGSAAQILLAWEDPERMHRGLQNAAFSADRAVRHPPPRLGAVASASASRASPRSPRRSAPPAARSSPPSRSPARSSGCPASPAGCTPPPSSLPPSGCPSRCAAPPPSDCDSGTLRTRLGDTRPTARVLRERRPAPTTYRDLRGARHDGHRHDLTVDAATGAARTRREPGRQPVRTTSPSEMPSEPTRRVSRWPSATVSDVAAMASARPDAPARLDSPCGPRGVSQLAGVLGQRGPYRGSAASQPSSASTGGLPCGAAKDSAPDRHRPDNRWPDLEPDWREPLAERVPCLAEAWRVARGLGGMTRAGGVDLPGRSCALVAPATRPCCTAGPGRATGQAYECDDATRWPAWRFVGSFDDRAARPASLGLETRRRDLTLPPFEQASSPCSGPRPRWSRPEAQKSASCSSSSSSCLRSRPPA